MQCSYQIQKKELTILNLSTLLWWTNSFLIDCYSRTLITSPCRISVWNINNWSNLRSPDWNQWHKNAGPRIQLLPMQMINRSKELHHLCADTRWNVQDALSNGWWGWMARESENSVLLMMTHVCYIEDYTYVYTSEMSHFYYYSLHSSWFLYS